MRVAFIARATLYSTPGGDTKQVDLTAEYLRKLGPQVDILLTDQKIDYSKYDLLHFFNIIRPADILPHILKSRLPYVVSTIFLDYGEFEKKARKGIFSYINKIFNEDQIEYLKVIARWVKNGERVSSKYYLLNGHRASVKKVAKNAGILLPNSENEYRRFAHKYNLEKKYRVVPNGIHPEVATKTSKKNPKYEGCILCVARIEGRKNQLNLIRALNNTEYTLIIHGKPSPNNIGYYNKCREEAASNIQFSEWKTEEELYEMYHSAKVHVLPSYFETTGLSSLEAAVMGCNIVVTDKGDTKDYFEGHAWFCDPNSPSSIRKAIEEAYMAPYDERFRDIILQKYTWERAAEETLAGYKQALSNKG